VPGLGKRFWFYLLCSFNRSPSPANLSFPSPISSSGAVAKDAAPLAPTKALKTGARATPHSAPQPPPVVDIVAEAAKLREAIARGAQAAQQARAPGNGCDAGQSGAEAAAPADAVGEASRGGSDGAARPVGATQQKELVGTRWSAPPARRRWRPSSPSPRGLGSRESQRRSWRRGRRWWRKPTSRCPQRPRTRVSLRR